MQITLSNPAHFDLHPLNTNNQTQPTLRPMMLPAIITVLLLIIIALFIPGGFLFPQNKEISSVERLKKYLQKEVSSASAQSIERVPEIERLKKDLLAKPIIINYQVVEGLLLWPTPEQPGVKFHKVLSSNAFRTKDGLYLNVYELKDIDTGHSMIAITKDQRPGWYVGTKLKTETRSDGTKSITNDVAES